MDISRYLYEGTLLWTLTSNGYKYITLNLLTSISKLKVPWTLLTICSDKESMMFLRGQGFPCILYPGKKVVNGTQLAQWGSEHFKQYNFIKLDILGSFSKNPSIQTCIYLDGDIVVFRDFLPDLLMRLSTCPLQFQCDSKDPGPCEEPCTNCCTGLIAWRSSEDKGIFELQGTEKRALWAEKPDDQVWVNRELKTRIYATLPRPLYPNGAYITKFKELAEPFLLHFNHRVGTAKIGEMKRAGLWLIPY